MTEAPRKPSLQERLTRRWRDWAWWTSTSPLHSGRAIGALIALGLVMPIVLATIIGRALGDTAAIIVLSTIGAAALAYGLYLLIRKRMLVTAIIVFALTIGIGFAVWITATIGW